MNNNIDISLSSGEKVDISISMAALDHCNRRICSKRTKIYISI
jgi:hypothetical protein